MRCSVVIRTRNEAPRLRLTLASLEAQIALAEVVVVDDGSTDETHDVLSAASFPVTVVRHATAKGRSAAANAGAAAAQADVLIFLDGDTLASPNFVAAHLARHAERDGLIGRGETWHVRCTRILRDPEHGEPFAEQADRFASLPPHEREAMLVTASHVRTGFDLIAARASFGVYPGAAPARLAALEMAALRDGVGGLLWVAASGRNQSVRRDAFLACGGFDPAIDINEHRELARRLMLAGGRMVAVEEARTYHLIHRSGWRDPLHDNTWEERFWLRHPVPEVALLPVFWASLSGSRNVAPEHRIDSLAQLEALAATHSGPPAASAAACRAQLGFPERLG
jgi:GT2 family glycosyltransferase